MKYYILSFTLVVTLSLQGQIPNNLTESEKVFGLAKFWQEVNYNFVYLNKVDREKWDNEFQRLISDIINTPNDYEYYRTLQKYCAQLNDGHTNIYFPQSIYKILYNTHFGDYRLFITNIEGKAIVTRVNESKKEEIPIGSEILRVNGLKTKAYIELYVLPYISSSTDYIRQNEAYRLLFQGLEGSSYDIQMQFPNGSIRSFTLMHEETLEKDVYPPIENNQVLNFKWMNSEVAYVGLNSFQDSKLDSLFKSILPELYKAKKLIIDLRKNGGGSTNIGRKVLQYLTKDSIIYGSRNYSRLHIPSHKAWGKWTNVQDTIGDSWNKQSYLTYHDQFYHEFEYWGDTIYIDSPRIVVPTALLIGHGTASAAEDFLIYADNQNHMIKIGEPTYGSTGQPLIFKLPGGGTARICTKKDTYPDGREFVGYGIQPDIHIKRTLEDYIEGIDPVLDKALDYLNGT